MDWLERMTTSPVTRCANCEGILPRAGPCLNCLLALGLGELAAPAPALPGHPASEPGPRRFGGCEILEEIARGAMGIVYRAREVSPNRVVALKIVSSGQFAADAERARFLREAEAAGQLDHPEWPLDKA